MKRFFFPSLFSFSTSRNKKTVPRREQQAQRRQKKKGSAMSSLRQTAMFLLVFVFLLPYFPFPTSITADGAEAEQRENPVRLTVLQTTDMHGAAGADGNELPGIARIVSIVKSEREREKEILLIDCGDTALGSFSSTLDGGDAMFRIMNLAGYDAWIPGNHDFDRGIPALLKHAEMLRATTRLAANLEILREGKSKVFEDWVLLRKKGLRIAVIGLVPEHLPQWVGPAQLDGSLREGFLQTLDRIIPEVMRVSPDLIILAVHAGEFSPARLYADGKRHSLSALSARYPQIDLILGGHSHQCVPGKKLYPHSWFVQGPPHAEGLAKTTIAYDRMKKRIVSMQTEILFSADYPDAPEAVKLLLPLQRKSRETAEKPVASFRDFHTVDSSCQGKAKGVSSAAGTSSAASSSSVPSSSIPSGAPSILSISPALLICRAMTEETPAEMAFHGNPGKKELMLSPSGTFYEKELFQWMPYENTITILHLSPEEARAVINEQEQLRDRKSAMSVYGLEYRLNASGTVEGPLLLSRNGLPWERKEKDGSGGERIAFAFSSYAACGAGGRYPVLRAVAESKNVKRLEISETIRDVLRRFLTKNYPPSPEGDLKQEKKRAILLPPPS